MLSTFLLARKEPLIKLVHYTFTSNIITNLFPRCCACFSRQVFKMTYSFLNVTYKPFVII